MESFAPLAEIDTTPLGACFFRHRGDNVLVTSLVGDWLWLSTADFLAAATGELDADHAVMKALGERGMLAGDAGDAVARLEDRLSYLGAELERATIFLTRSVDGDIEVISDGTLNLTVGLATAREGSRIVLVGPNILTDGRAAIERVLAKVTEGANAHAVTVCVDSAELVAADEATREWLANASCELTVLIDDTLDADGPLAAWLDAYHTTRGERGNATAAITASAAMVADPAGVVAGCKALGVGEVAFGYAAPAHGQAGTYSIEAFNSAAFAVAEGLRAAQIREANAAAMLRTILGTDVPALGNRSPAASGLAEFAVDTDGTVYASPKGVALGRDEDTLFQLGDVSTLPYGEIVTHTTTRALATATILESQPGLSDHAYRPYVGADPAENYIQQGSIHGRLLSGWKIRTSFALLDAYFDLLREGDEVAASLAEWAGASR